MVTGALRVTAISKSFGGREVLSNVGLTVEKGQVHLLVGANGSGKSTLVKILAGLHDPKPGGTITVAERNVPLPMNPRRSLELGMRFLHQDLALFPTMSVAENIYAGMLSFPHTWSYRRSDVRRQATSLLRTHNVDIDVDMTVGELSRPDKAMVAFVRAIRQASPCSAPARQVRLLVLDEPTTGLRRSEADRILALTRDVASRGVGVLLVSHDIDAAMQIADRVTVLRDGRIVRSCVSSVASASAVVTDMAHPPVSRDRVNRTPRTDPTFVAVRDLADDILKPLSFDVAVGEVVGLTGIEGSHFERVPRILIGVGSARGGRIDVAGASLDLATLTPADARQARIAFVPADRQAEGIAESLAAWENLMLGVISRYGRRYVLRRGAMRADAVAILARFGVTPPNPELPLGAFSGGNQQKIVLARSLLADPLFLILHEPTAGVDVAARAQLNQVIRSAASDGLAVLYVSREADELAAVCDRVLMLDTQGQIEQRSYGHTSKAMHTMENGDE